MAQPWQAILFVRSAARDTPMVGRLNKQRIVLVVIASAIASVTLRILSLGTYCLVPSTNLKVGELATAETSIYGLVLYRETGTDYMDMYHQAVWWYEVTLIGIWAAAVVAGVGACVIVGRLWRPGGAERSEAAV